MTLNQKLNVWHSLTLVSYSLLLLLLLAWPFIYPSETLASWLVALIWVIPLLFPGPGIFKQRYYTYAWSQFINMIYFCHAIVFIMTSESELYIAIIELLLVILFFTATIMSIQIKKKITTLEQNR
ncbi:DUF2069 domain-containing protein [Pleionea sediminis]|uniref:DUF2069 domain-containing protein n=1 Tax=Pleionea sediminis TaxID=2569479 RepID=UPI00118544CD|nr:DUF2069 domain-containing protein [Pleionea sediminis]